MSDGDGFIRWTASAAYYDADGQLVHVEGDDEFPATRAGLEDDPVARGVVLPGESRITYYDRDGNIVDVSDEDDGIINSDE